jgi:iron complex outermembrane receptor protein
MRVFISSVLLLLFASAGFASQALELEEVTVTANKTKGDLQTTPAAISVLDDTALEDKRIQSLSDVADFTPGFHLYETGILGLYVPSMRGKSAENGSASAVGLYIDGVPVLSGTGFNDVLLDIERVEVLKGPQGTLYGKNAQAGVINVITKKPSNRLAAKISGELGEDHKYRLSASASGPIVRDKLYLGISGLHYQKDGFLTYAASGHTVNDKKYNYGKGHLRWTPTSNLTVSLIASAIAHDDGGFNMNIGERYARLYGIALPADREVGSDLEGWNKTESDMQALRIAWEIDESFSLESITTRRKYRSHYLADFDFTPLALMHKKFDSTELKYSQELRLSYRNDKIRALTGVYLDRDENEFCEIDDTTNLVAEHHTTDKHSLGLFVNADVDLTQKLTLTAGLRYDRDKGEYDEPARSRHLRETWEEFSPKVSLSYRFTPNTMIYVSAAKGYLSGGFNEHAAPENPVSYDQEELMSYEIGVKNRFFNNRMTLNLAAYHMAIDDLQVSIYDANPEYNYTGNAAKAASTGAELEFQALLAQGLTLSAGFSYNHAKFRDYSDAWGDYSGHKIPYTPEYSYSLGMIYRHAVGFYLSSDFIGYGKTYLNKENDYPRSGYFIVNSKIGYETRHFDIYLYADNLFDERYDSDGYFGGFYTVCSPPREIGINLSYRY